MSREAVLQLMEHLERMIGFVRDLLRSTLKPQEVREITTILRLLKGMMSPVVRLLEVNLETAETA